MRSFKKILLQASLSPLGARQRSLRSGAFRPLFGAVAVALILAAALAPRADADVVAYFNFEGNTFTSVAEPGPGGMYPFLQNQTILNSPTNPFSPGGLLVVPGVGTTMNQLAGDVTPTNSALALRGNTNGTATLNCFRFGVNTTGYAQASLSFALQSVGNGTQFSQMQVRYSTNGGASFTVTPEGLVTIPHTDTAFHIYTFNISGAGNTANALIEVCFTGSTTNAGVNVTRLDNLQINAIVPEPATVTGGVLGVMGLCWYQRRRLIRSLRWRRA
jgi:hypothetical protein